MGRAYLIAASGERRYAGHPRLLSIDRRLRTVIEDVRDLECVAVRIRVQRQRGAALPNRYRALHFPDRSMKRLHVDTGLDERRHKTTCRTIQPRRFECIQFDVAVIDAQAGQRGQDVFDKANLHRQMTERRPPPCVGHPIDPGRNVRPGIEIGPHED